MYFKDMADIDNAYILYFKDTAVIVDVYTCTSRMHIVDDYSWTSRI